MSYHLQEINRRIQADPKEFVDASDAAYAAKIERAARAIAENAHTCPIVLLSGPSGSGKTTTAMKIAEALCKLGVGARVSPWTTISAPSTCAPHRARRRAISI